MEREAKKKPGCSTIGQMNGRFAALLKLFLIMVPVSTPFIIGFCVWIVIGITNLQRSQAVLSETVRMHLEIDQ